MTEAYTELTRTIDLTRHAWRLRRAMEGALLILAVALAAATALALADRWAAPGVGGRLLLAALGWAAVLATAWGALFRPLAAHHHQDFFAALLEERLGLAGHLINAVQLGRAATAGAPAPLPAPALVEAIVKDAARHVDEIEPHRAVRGPAMRRHALFAGAGALLAAGAWFGGGPPLQTSFQRVLLPTAAIAPFTWTQVDVAVTAPETFAERGRILEGTPVALRITTTGRPPGEAQIHWRMGEGPPRTARATPTDAPDVFTFRLPDPAADLTLRATAGDGQSASLHLPVDARPRITAMTARHVPPDYTGRPPRRQDSFDGHVQALAGTRLELSFETNKPLESLEVSRDGRRRPAEPAGAAGRRWKYHLTLQSREPYRLHLRDREGYTATSPTPYRLTPLRDNPPSIALTRPGRDLAIDPGAEVGFTAVAEDDYGLATLQLLGHKADEAPAVLHTWPLSGEGPERQARGRLARSVSELGLAPGDRLTYWAVATDRNDVTGPGRTRTRPFHLRVLTPEQAETDLDRQLNDYIRALTAMIRLQRENMAKTEALAGAEPLIERQAQIRHRARRLAETMERNTFPAPSVIETLHELAGGPMARALTLLERYRDAANLEAGRPFADRSLEAQAQVLEALEALLERLSRAGEVRRRLRRAEKHEPEKHRQVTETLDRLADDLDRFLSELGEMEEDYEKLPKRAEDPAEGQRLDELEPADHRLDRWERWFKDSVDAITKLPDGFVPDAGLAENVSTIFEEIEKQPRSPSREVATPLEEGIKALAQEVAEDLEMWMPHEPDDTRWVMEDPTEGMFEVPDTTLSGELQDMIGDLVEDMESFDEEADDVTGAWGGNMQAGWDIDDGPISSFDARGKTGNQLPNASEMSGRSGSGRRGRASGQMVGAESRAMEGRPTPARLTNEPYEEGLPEADKQLDPRGATGGGKKTGGGQRGLQGDTPPDLVEDMERLAREQKLMRERAQQLARQLEAEGRPLAGVQRAIDLMSEAEQDYRDLRYTDAARRRKEALDAIRAAEHQADRGAHLSLQKARHLPPEMREEIAGGAREALPEGYEELVGAYYRALSTGPEE